MTTSLPKPPLGGSLAAWLSAALAGVVAPAAALLLLADPLTTATFGRVGGAVLAIGLMGTGMIAAAASGRLWVGVVLALLAGGGLVLLAQALGGPPLAHPSAVVLALVIASVSFAARGALFARSSGDRGWWIAVAVVAGEAAIVATASARPDALPDWLLVLLPAQWATTAIQTALSGSGTLAASSALIALAGTAAATLMVALLWPRRWPYLVMFTTWLGLSALVWDRPAPPIPSYEPVAVSAAYSCRSASIGSSFEARLAG
jgi:hypothetical protein